MSLIDNTSDYKRLFNTYLKILSEYDIFKFRCEEIFSRASFLDETEMKTFVLLIDNSINDIDGFEILRRNLLLRQIDCKEFIKSVDNLKELLN